MNHRRPATDRGSILPLVLVVALVMSTVMIALAKYATSGLKYADVVELRADRLAAADGGMQFGIEKLRLNQTLCTTNAASGSGVTTAFPPLINDATTTVNCQRVGAGLADTQGWAVVVTGGASGTGELKAQGGIDKTFGGPIYMYDRTKFSLSGGDLTIENGDLWYQDSDCSTATFTPPSKLKFDPAFLRGPICTEQPWSALFTAPTTNVPTGSAVAPATLGACKVFSPGKYTTAPALGQYNYFKAGEYYFENVNFEVRQSQVIAGFSDGRYGDTQAFTAHPDCATAQSIDALSGALPGATFYLGGTSTIYVNTQGELEILRRAQGNGVVSVQALDSNGAGYIASSVALSPPIVDVKAGDQQDLAMHGLVWAPRAFARFNNVANKARGQALGGLAIGSLEAQSPNGDGLLIRVEQNPFDSKLLLTSTATKGGASTTIRAVVQVQPDTDYLAVNSWRVID